MLEPLLRVQLGLPQQVQLGHLQASRHLVPAPLVYPQVVILLLEVPESQEVLRSDPLEELPREFLPEALVVVVQVSSNQVSEEEYSNRLANSAAAWVLVCK